jgi:hypothetical protein
LKKIKSPSSKRNGRFHPSKCRGDKVQKIGVLYTHSSKMLSPSANFLIAPKKEVNFFFFKPKKLEKGG